MEPPIGEVNRAPDAWLTIDIAGMGEKPATRSGPRCLIVWTLAAATISAASPHEARRQAALAARGLVAHGPSRDRPRRRLQASTGSPSRCLASRYISSRTPRTYG